MIEELVSIITPSYNSEQFISKTIDSVLSQTYSNWELIIIDDKSPDHSNDIIHEYVCKDSRIKLVELEENRGPAVARNAGIKLAKGKYIAFLDADDLWMPEKLSIQISIMIKKRLAFTYTSYFLIGEDGNDLGIFETKAEATYEAMLKGSFIGCLSAIYDTEKLGKLYMPDVLKRQDYALWLNILKTTDAVEGILSPLGIYRIREESVSSNKIAAASYQWKIYREVEKLSFIKSFFYFLSYVYNGIKKYK